MSTDTKICVRSVHSGGIDVSLPDPYDASSNQTITFSWEQLEELQREIDYTLEKYGKGRFKK